MVLDEFVEYEGMGEELDVAIQGMGNVGSYLAEFLDERGYNVVAVSNSSGGIHNPDGIDVPEMLELYRNGKGLEGFGEEITNDELLTLNVDVLVPAAIEDQITDQNMDEISADAVLEMANGPTTPAADEHLSERGVAVVPDILANAGGVTVSYFEWVQNEANEYWSEDKVNNKLAEQMRTAFDGIRRVKEEGDDLTWRSAAYVHAVNTVLDAEGHRGNVSRS